ncbi:MAG: Zn-ribbon containing protein [Candidatus Woesearchaeota archaeon]|jgi:predicted  nucleic acid-binding Zn-ribbon protein
MPHQCVRCGILYGDSDAQVLKGCTCGAKLFFYVKKDAIERAKKIQKELTVDEREQIAKDAIELVGSQADEKVDEPIVLDFEAINISTPGKYEIDLVHLLSGQPVIYKMEDGKYMIDIASSFQMLKNDPNSKQNKKKK